MYFFAEAIGVLQTLVIALGAGLAVWGVINLLEGYGNDNPGTKSQGIKQLMAGGGVALIGFSSVALPANLFSEKIQLKSAVRRRLKTAVMLTFANFTERRR